MGQFETTKEDLAVAIVMNKEVRRGCRKLNHRKGDLEENATFEQKFFNIRRSRMNVCLRMNLDFSKVEMYRWFGLISNIW